MAIVGSALNAAHTPVRLDKTIAAAPNECACAVSKIGISTECTEIQSEHEDERTISFVAHAFPTLNKDDYTMLVRASSLAHY